jgi:hypothetical protein
VTDTLILLHRIVGYPTVFVVAPLALFAFADPRRHRLWGKGYFYLMLFLYTTGTFFTLTQHDWLTWNFARNLTFNFFGFSMLVYAYRSIVLFARPGRLRPDRLDFALARMMELSVLALFSVAVWKNTPMRVFTLAGIWFCVLERRELSAGVWEKPVLYRRHQRYILASYFYVLTVVSVVHLGDELPQNWKWLWPTLCGALAIWLLTSAKQSGRSADWLKGVPQAALTRWVVWGALSLSFVFGSYVIYDLLYGSSLQGQAMEAR